MAGFLPSFNSSGLFRGAGAGIVPYSTCANTPRHGAISRSRRRSYRGKQRGGKCPCMVGGGRGVSRKHRYSRKQRGGAGFAVNPMDNQLGKVPVYDTTACQMPRPPTQFGGSSRRSDKQSLSQKGGAALVGSNIGSMTQSIGGLTQPASGLVYPATTAAYTFDLAGSKNFKNTYAAVAPMNGRVGPASCRSRKRGRKHA